MKRDLELELIDELRGLKTAQSAFLDEAVGRNPIEHYTDENRFAEERAKIFSQQPHAAAHISELKKPGDFVRSEIAGIPLLLTRDQNGEVHAFINACRHRGTRLVDDQSGCKRRFSCPYHAWTYASSGELVGAPHFKEGFPNTEQNDLGLVELPSSVRFGFVWVFPQAGADLDIDRLFAPMVDELDALGLDKLEAAADETSIRTANWKVLVEGGIEAYHFKIAHSSTIGPYFEDNLSSYRTYGDHMRSVLPRTSLATLDPDNRATWRLRDHANILYTLFPSSQLLVQQDHVVWIRSNPLSAGATELRIVTLAPQTEDKEHWERNHAITTTTLDEDFVIGESIQSTARSGANAEMIFGRFEGALVKFNQTVERHLAI